MPSPYSAGSIFLQVVPSFRGAKEAIEREARDWGDNAGKSFDEGFDKKATASAKKTGQKVGKALADEMQKPAAEAGKKAGDEYGGRFATSVKAAVQRASKEVATFKVDVDDKAAQAKVRQLTRDLEALGGKADIGMDLNVGTVMAKLAAVETELRDLQDSATSIDMRVNSASALQEVTKVRAELMALSSIQIEPEIKVDRQMGAFERSLKGAIDGALRDLGTVDIGATSDAGQRAVADLRKQLYDLSDKTIGVDISSETARAQLEMIRDELKQITSEHWSVDLDANTAAAETNLAAFLAVLDEIDGRHVDVKVDVKDNMSMLTFLSGLEREGIAAGKSLDELGNASKRSATSGQDGANAFRAFNTRVLGIAALGPLVVPALGAIAGGIAALLPLAATGGAALGVLALGLMNVGAAYKAMGAMQQSAASDAVTYAKGVDTAQRQVRDAQDGLTKARADAAQAFQDSARQVSDAERGVSDAQKNAAQSAEDSAKRVTDAQRSVTDARREAGQSAEDAARQVTQAEKAVTAAEADVVSAERDLRNAQHDSQRAQEDLTQARQDAADQLDELNLRVRDGALDQRQAVLDLHDAEKKLNDARANGTTGDELEKLQIAYDRAKLRIDQTAESAQQLGEEQAKWAKTGIEGSDGVVSAQDRVTSATQGVADAQQKVLDANAKVGDAQDALARAREKQAQDAEDGARRIADAEDNLATARRDQVRQQETSARAVADAERTLSDARRDQARQQADSQAAVAKAQQGVTDSLASYSDALAKTSSSQTKFAEAMAKLSPTGRAFVQFLDDLKPKLSIFSQLAEEGLLPGLASWMDTIVTTRGPQLQSIISGISGALGDMFGRFANSMQGPAFSQLFDMMDNAGPRFIGYMGGVLTNLGEGVASLTAAMEPLGDLFGTWLIEATAKFKEWAGNLSGSTGLQDFFSYVQRVGPEIGDFFSKLGEALINIAKAVAPFAEGLMNVLTDAFAWIATLDPQTLEKIVLGIGGVVLGLQALFGLKAGLESLNSGLRIMDDVLARVGTRGGAIAAVGGQVGLFAGGMAVLYTQSDLVRDVVNDVFNTFVDFGKWLVGGLENLKTLAAVLGTVAAAWKVGGAVGAGLGSLGKAAEQYAPAVGVMAANITGSQVAGEKAMTTMGKFGGVLGKLGGALPIVGIGFGLIAAGIEASNNAAAAQQGKMNDWFTNLHAGGEKAQEAKGKIDGYNKAMADEQAEIDRLTKKKQETGDVDGFLQAQISQLTVAIHDQRDKINEAQKTYDDWYKKLTPIEQAQADLQEAQTNLTYAIKEHGKYSDEAKDASERYSNAQERMKQLQYDVASATSGLNQALQDQLGLMMDLAGAELAYEQAASSLADAHKRVKDALAQYGPKSKEYKDALLAEEGQMDNTAKAAERVAESRYANADATTRQAAGQAAYLIELNKQKETYGELPPRLEAIRQSLEKNVDPAMRAAQEFYNLGVNVKDVPDSKTIIIDAPTAAQEKALTDLGLHVQHLPDGSVKVTADSEQAQKIIDDILKPKTLEVSVAVTGFPTGEQVQKQLQDGGAGALAGYGFGVPSKNIGGHITGPGSGTSDDVPIWASNGEYIVKAASVRKYGLGFFDQINEGRYASGGLIQKRGRAGLAYAGGGAVSANWGGTISLSGGSLNPLAGLWFSALQQISDLAGQAAGLISGAFGGMKDTAEKIFGDTATGVMGKWTPFLAQLQDTTGATRDKLNETFGQTRDWIGQRVGETRDAANIGFGQMRDWLSDRAGETRDATNGAFSQTRDWLKDRAAETRDGANDLFAQLRDKLFGRTEEARDGVNSRTDEMKTGFLGKVGEMLTNVGINWATLPGLLLNPVNTVIDKILNFGLFKAFNAIVGALGLDSKLNIPHVDPAKLAAGGQVPGWSPHDKADNIPAMLTAGEYVHPVDSVNYYGPDFMEAIRKKRIPREAIQRYATGGYVAMQNAVKKQFPWARITSAYRPGDPGYHGKGQAIDVAGSDAYPGGQSVAQMAQINQWIAKTFKNITELIHTGPGSINLWHNAPHVYNQATQDEHRNHVHWAQEGGLDGSGGILSTLGKLFGVAVDAISDPAAFLKDTVEKALGGFGGNPVADIMAAGVRKMAGFAVDKVTGFLSDAFGFGDGDLGDVGLTGNAADNESMAKSMAAKIGWVGSEWSALRTLWMKESGFSNLAQNPSSTAFGIPQFLDSTWATVGMSKTADPKKQIEAGIKYIAQRYITPSKALAFHNRNNSYHDGGLVQDRDSATGAIVPDLHDTGGWLQPGLNVIMNRTGRPEPTINPQTLDALQTIAGQGGTAPMIGAIHQYLQDAPTAPEIASEIMHAATVASRGGKY